MSEMLFAEAELPIPDFPAEPCKWPYFILAYWPTGKSWAIKQPLGTSDPAKFAPDIRDLQARGWKYVTVVRIPSGDHPWNEKL